MCHWDLGLGISFNKNLQKYFSKRVWLMIPTAWILKSEFNILMHWESILVQGYPVNSTGFGSNCIELCIDLLNIIWFSLRATTWGFCGASWIYLRKSHLICPPYSHIFSHTWTTRISKVLVYAGFFDRLFWSRNQIIVGMDLRYNQIDQIESNQAFVDGSLLTLMSIDIWSH